MFSRLVLRRHLVAYYFCDVCGLLQTEPPYWLEEAYGEPIASTDTGVVSRNITAARRLAPILHSIDPTARYLDAGAGYGFFVRRMRDLGFDFRWDDPHSPNLFARGFERAEGDTFRAVTAIEVAEHLPDPLGWIQDTLRSASSRTILFTTSLFAREPDPEWWYLSCETGQHVSFYQRRTLRTMAARLGLRSLSHGVLHAFTELDTPQWKFATLVSRASGLAWALQRRTMMSRTFPDHVAVRKALGSTNPTEGAPTER